MMGALDYIKAAQRRLQEIDRGTRFVDGRELDECVRELSRIEARVAAIMEVIDMNEYERALMGRPSVDTMDGTCAVCGKPATDKHHIVKRSAGTLRYADGTEVTKPTVRLCGSGNASGCHGLAHAQKLHFRYVEAQVDGFGAQRKGHWEYLHTREATKYERALEMDGWRRLVTDRVKREDLFGDYEKGRKVRPIVCVETGDKFASIVAAARLCGCTAPSIVRALKTGGACMGKHWNYAD